MKMKINVYEKEPTYVKFHELSVGESFVFRDKTKPGHFLKIESQVKALLEVKDNTLDLHTSKTFLTIRDVLVIKTEACLAIGI